VNPSVGNPTSLTDFSRIEAFWTGRYTSGESCQIDMQSVDEVIQIDRIYLFQWEWCLPLTALLS